VAHDGLHGSSGGLYSSAASVIVRPPALPREMVAALTLRLQLRFDSSRLANKTLPLSQQGLYRAFSAFARYRPAH
jgi:hypothetical protein